MIVSSSASKSLDSNRSGSEHKKELFDVLYTLSYGESFSPFRIMRNGDHEIRHSNVLAWLFDKNAKNNIFGNGFAVSFFSSVEAYKDVNWEEKFREEIIVDTEVASDVKPFQDYLNSNPQIRDEYEEINKKRQSPKKTESTDDDHVLEADCSVIEDSSFDNSALRNKRIDILIIGETFTCTIENKIHAGEHDWQCQYYKHYINNKYPDRENYFVFLDIDKPNNWDDETLIYQGYELVTYEGVITILNELINGKEESDTIRFIEQYIDTLDELYGRYKEDIERVIKDHFHLTKDIISLSRMDEGMTTRLLDAKSIFHNYAIRNIMPKNDEVVRLTLHELVDSRAMTNVNDDGELVEYHSGKASVSDPYGYKINVSKYNTQRKKDRISVKSYLNEIDYVSRYGCFSVNIYFNADNQCVKTIKDKNVINEFLLKYKKMREENWSFVIEFNIKDGGGQSGKAYSLLLDLDKSNVDLLLEYWNNEDAVARSLKRSDLINERGEVNENHAILRMIKDNEIVFYDASGKDTNYSTIKEYIEDYFRRHKESTSRLIFEWVVALEYQINTDPIVDDKARVAISKDLARTYYRITREGLNLFNLGDEFVEKIFKSEYAN